MFDVEILQFIGWLLAASWDFFTEINVPGFDFTFAALFVGLFLANLGLRFLFMMLGIGVGSSSDIENMSRFHFYERQGWWPDKWSKKK
ncbi:hypothetical protein SDC9_65419 [bioreactor metagenome]|uniref:Uncharacterized protein n=1 Tax=bioreactor metagenome TaxID=1076179 RepID=A0A644XTB5_9ZZZZ